MSDKQSELTSSLMEETVSGPDLLPYGSILSALPSLCKVLCKDRHGDSEVCVEECEVGRGQLFFPIGRSLVFLFVFAMNIYSCCLNPDVFIPACAWRTVWLSALSFHFMLLGSSEGDKALVSCSLPDTKTQSSNLLRRRRTTRRITEVIRRRRVSLYSRKQPGMNEPALSRTCSRGSTPPTDSGLPCIAALLGGIVVGLHPPGRSGFPVSLLL